MKLPRVRFTVRRLMIAVAIAALAAALASSAIGPKDGLYTGSYSYLGSDLKWHAVDGTILYVDDGAIFAY